MGWSWSLAGGLLGGGALLVVGGLMLHAPAPLSEFVRPVSDVIPADMRVQQVRVVEQTETGQTWELVAEEAELYDAQHLIVVHRVQAHLQTHTAQPVHVVAAHGQIEHTTGNATLQGHVRVMYVETYTIVTDVLYWQAASQSLHTPAAVTVEGATMRIAGRGLLGQVAEQRFVLQDEVHATFHVP